MKWLSSADDCINHATLQATDKLLQDFSLPKLRLRFPNRISRFRHQTIATRCLQPLFPVLPSLLVEPSPLLPLHCLALLRDLALELFALARKTPQRWGGVSEPGCCGFEGSFVGFLLAVGVFESHADGPDCVEREIVVGWEGDAAGVDGGDKGGGEGVEVDPGGAGVVVGGVGGSFGGVLAAGIGKAML